MTNESLSGQHFVWFVRSTELAKKTFQLQVPLEVTLMDRHFPLNLQFKSARFSDSLDSLIFLTDYKAENEKIFAQLNNNPLANVSCSNLFVNSSYFGGISDFEYLILKIFKLLFIITLI